MMCEKTRLNPDPPFNSCSERSISKAVTPQLSIRDNSNKSNDSNTNNTSNSSSSNNKNNNECMDFHSRRISTSHIRAKATCTPYESIPNKQVPGFNSLIQGVQAQVPLSIYLQRQQYQYSEMSHFQLLGQHIPIREQKKKLEPPQLVTTASSLENSLQRH
ncbi:hypothetical protein HK100_010092, partial [Physocladia obscura]